MFEKRVLSLGAGVQSTTLALMAARRDIGPMPDAAIFADTGWEPKSVYAHLNWLTGQLPFPVHIVSNGHIRDNIMARQTAGGGRFAAIPWFTRNLDGSFGMGRRQCTYEHKLKPIMWKMRELLGKGRRARIAPGSAEIWIGISTDEAGRMKPASQMWQTNRWPLIEAGMSRNDCLRWLEERQYPKPPKSACIGCPFHSNAMWREMKNEQPEEWADAVLVDKALRDSAAGDGGEEFMHARRIPLDEVDLSTAEERGQGNFFMNECEGMCGV